MQTDAGSFRTGRVSGLTFSHGKKLIEKSKVCHKKTSQPPLDTKRKWKRTKFNECKKIKNNKKNNKNTKKKKKKIAREAHRPAISSPNEVITMLNRIEKSRTRIATCSGGLCHVEWMGSYHRITRDAKTRWCEPMLEMWYKTPDKVTTIIMCLLYTFFSREYVTLLSLFWSFLTSLVLCVTILVPLYHTMLTNVTANTLNQRKLGWWYGIGKRK